MSTLIFALALFGCSDDATVCERISTDLPRYETQVACNIAAETAVMSEEAMRADFPTVIAECVTEGALLAMSDGVIDLTQPLDRQAATTSARAR